MLQDVSTRRICFYQAITLGFYFFYWCFKSRRDILESAGRDIIPSTWLLAVPAANYWWMWRYANALDFVSYGRIKFTDTFLLYVVVINLAFVTPPLFNDLFIYRNDVSNNAIVAVFLVIFLVIVIISIASLGFFCVVMQKRISKLHKTNSSAPLNSV